MNISAKTRLSQNQSGFASIVVAMMLILVLSLITVGFAQLARREQQNALNKQLSSQAYYAAESGINDGWYMAMLPGGLYDREKAARNSIPNSLCLNNTALWSNPNTPTNTHTKGAIQTKIDDSTGTSYSCVMIDLRPKSLEYTAIGSGSYRNVLFQPVGNINTFEVHWGSDDGHNGFPGGGFKPKTGSASNWGNSLAMIQISITPIPPGSFTRDYLQNNTFTSYLYPRNGVGDTITYDVTPNGNTPVKNATCTAVTTDRYSQCVATINGIPGNANYSYLVHFVSYYDDATNVLLVAKNGSLAVATIGGQIVIDSTGRARDVLKRLQIHAPVNPQPYEPKDAIESQSICKRFTTYPNSQPQPENPVNSDNYSGNACKFWSQP